MKIFVGKNALYLCVAGAGGAGNAGRGDHRHLTPLLCPAPEWLDPGDNGGAVKRFQLGLHYSLIYCDRPPRPAVMSMLPTYFWAS